MSLPISKIMKSVVLTTDRNESVTTALARMEKAGVRHLPVVDGGRHLVGVVSERDLARAVAMMQTAEGRREIFRVGDVMHAGAPSIARTMPAHEAAALLIEHQLGMLPVVDEETGTVCGIVTTTDFLELLRETLIEADAARRVGGEADQARHAGA